MFKLVLTSRSALTARFITNVRIKSTLSKNTSPVVSDKGKPLKFTTSGAHVDYRATMNFYGDDRDLPNSHNAVLATTSILAIFYLIFLRDDIEGGGGKDLARPAYETVPEVAIPLLESAIAENKKFGKDTTKLEKKLHEKMAELPAYKRELIEN